MAIPAFLCLPGAAGMRFAGVFRKQQMLGDLAEVLLVGTDRTMLFTSRVPNGIFTVYQALVCEINPVFLCSRERLSAGFFQ